MLKIRACNRGNKDNRNTLDSGVNILKYPEINHMWYSFIGKSIAVKLHFQEIYLSHNQRIHFKGSNQGNGNACLYLIKTSANHFMNIKWFIHFFRIMISFECKRITCAFFPNILTCLGRHQGMFLLIAVFPRLPG